MAQTISAQCNFCHKRFQLRSDQLNRNVRCPHCKMIVRIPATSATARQAVAEMDDIIAQEKSEQEKRPITARHEVKLATGGVRSKNVAIVWLVLLGVALVVCIGFFVYWAISPKPHNLAQNSTVPIMGKPAPSQPAGSTAPATGAKAMPADTQAAAPQTAATPNPKDEPVPFEVERIISGYKDGTVTYALGRIKNNTGAPIKTLKIVISMLDAKDKELGAATAVLLNLPPGVTVPLVAEWQHEPGVRVARWRLSEMTPDAPGISRDLPPILAEDAWAVRDTSLTSTGEIKAKVTNLGTIPVRAVEMFAILLDSSGKIVGAAKGVVDQPLLPKKPETVKISWERTPGHQVASAEVWAQPPL